MSTPEHTPTPWKAETHRDDYPEVIGPDRQAICDAVETLPDAEHIVRCVNAHDDLLAAARFAQAWILGLTLSGGGDGEVLAKLHEAIAKATGGDS